MRIVPVSLLLLPALLLACTDAQHASTVPSGDRIPDSFAARAEDGCRASPGNTLPPEVRNQICSCVAREMQRTISMKDTIAFGQQLNAVGDEVAKNRVILGNEAIRQIMVTCVNQVIGQKTS